MRKNFVMLFQFCFLGVLIIGLGMAIFDVPFPQRATFLVLFIICSLAFLWFLTNFLLDVWQHRRDGWNFGVRKPRLVFQHGEFGGGSDLSPQEMIRFGYPLAILIL
jgi:hypothetical protein